MHIYVLRYIYTIDDIWLMLINIELLCMYMMVYSVFIAGLIQAQELSIVDELITCTYVI